jgi:hypothetical protein
MNELTEQITKELADLTTDELKAIQEYIEFMKWRRTQEQ